MVYSRWEYVMENITKCIKKMTLSVKQASFWCFFILGFLSGVWGIPISGCRGQMVCMFDECAKHAYPVIFFSFFCRNQYGCVQASIYAAFGHVRVRTLGRSSRGIFCLGYFGFVRMRTYQYLCGIADGLGCFLCGNTSVVILRKYGCVLFGFE